MKPSAFRKQCNGVRAIWKRDLSQEGTKDMNMESLEQFIQQHGREVLNFCRMTAGNRQDGDELYQETMLKMLEKQNTIDEAGNVKAYAISTAVLLWKNQKRKYARRLRILPVTSMEEMLEAGREPAAGEELDPERTVLRQEAVQSVRKAAGELPERLRIPLYMYYSADMKIREIAEALRLPEATVKTRLRRAKESVKKKLEAEEHG